MALKDLDKRHQRHGQRGCVKVPSHDLSLVSATEGTERGRRGGVPSGMGGSERAPEPLYVGSRSYWVCNTSTHPLRRRGALHRTRCSPRASGRSASHSLLAAEIWSRALRLDAGRPTAWPLALHGVKVGWK